MSQTYIQKHWPVGSGGCTRDVKMSAQGLWQVKGSNSMKDGDDVMQNAINNAIANGDRYAIYTKNGSQYYVEVNPKDDGDDSKSDSGSDVSDVEDLLNDPEPGLAFVGDGASQKLDIAFNTQQSVVSLKQDFADKLQCDPDEIQAMAWIGGEIVEVSKQTLADNGVTDPKDLLIFKKEDRTDAVIKMMRAKKWEDKKFRKQAKKWLKGSGNEGKQGIDNLIKKNGLDDGWNDVFEKLDYTDVLKIIKDDGIMSRIDQIRVDGDARKKYNISDNQIAALTYSEIAKMAKKTKQLRDQFYDDMGKAAINPNTIMALNTDCAKMFDQFEPKKMTFIGVISLIDGKDLKAMGIRCKNVDQIKKGQVFVYPSTAHNKDITFRNNTVNKGYAPGHPQICDLVGLPPMFCAGFGIMPPVLKFRSGNCNSSKVGKVKGFDNDKELNQNLRNCLKTAFKNTSAQKFYDNH